MSEAAQRAEPAEPTKPTLAAQATGQVQSVGPALRAQVVYFRQPALPNEPNQPARRLHPNQISW